MKLEHLASEEASRGQPAPNLSAGPIAKYASNATQYVTRIIWELARSRSGELDILSLGLEIDGVHASSPIASSALFFIPRKGTSKAIDDLFLALYI